MVRRTNAGNDSSAGRTVDGGDSDVKDKLIMALIAVIAGGGGTAIYQNSNPPRPDPQTGTMAREQHAEIYRYIDTRLQAYERHEQEAASWKARILENERQCQKMKSKYESLEEDCEEAH